MIRKMLYDLDIYANQLYHIFNHGITFIPLVTKLTVILSGYKQTVYDKHVIN